MSKEAPVADTGVGLGAVLFIVFLVLKLTGLVAWSWWWVTAPLWIPAAVILLVGTILVAAVVVLGLDSFEF